MLMRHTQNGTQILKTKCNVWSNSVWLRLVVVFWVGGVVDKNPMELREHVSVSWPFQNVWLG